MSTQQNIEKAFIITEKLKKNKGKKGYNKIESLYEGVIHKNFQTIDQLLKKLNFILTRHEQFEVELAAHIKKFAKFECDLETIHNEHRRDNLIINTNINGIRTDIMGIDTHIKLLFDGVKYKGVSNLSVQNTKPFQPYIQQNQRNLSVFSSANKLSECSELNRRPVEKDQQMYSKKSFDTISHQRNSLKIKATDSIGGSLSNFESRPETLNQSVTIKKQRHIPESINFQKESSIRLIEQQRYSSHTKNSHLSKQSLGSNQNQQKLSKEIIECLEPIKTALQSKNERKQQKVDIVATFTRHSNKISSIFKAAREEDLNQQEMKQKITNIVNSILVQDSELGQKLAKGLDTQQASKQITQFLYLCMFGDNSVEKQKQKQKIKQRLIALEKQNLRINIQLNKINQIQEKLSKNNNQLQEIKQQFYKISRKDQMFKQFNRLQQKIANTNKQILEIRQSTKGYITYEQMSNQHFKMVEKNKKNWEDCYSTFANKSQTKKAIQYMDNKIKQVVVNLKLNQNIQIQQSDQKCLCCTKTVVKVSAPRLTMRTARNSNTSSGQTTKRIKPNELKKKTMEVFKENKVRGENSKSVNFSFA